MKDENLTATKETQVSNLQQPITIAFSNKESEVVKVVCDVCGHANPKYTAICEMCSNYLKN